jgi:uncharacterized protein YbjT (DUF2867 family)
VGRGPPDSGRSVQPARAGNPVRRIRESIGAAADLATAVARAALGPPINGIIEVAGPEQFGLDELVRTELAARDDSRRVVADSQAPYFGAVLDERTSGRGAAVFQTRFADWLTQKVSGG